MNQKPQELFELIREGDKNASFKLNLFLSILMGRSGEITRIYHKYRVDEDDQDEINARIREVLYTNILVHERNHKIADIKEDINLKWYLKKVAYNLIQEFFRLTTKSRTELAQQVKRDVVAGKSYNATEVDFDGYDKDPEEDKYMSEFYNEDIDVSEVDSEIEYFQFYKELFEKLPASKCKRLFELIFQDSDPDQIIKKMRNGGFAIKDRRNLAKEKHACKERLRKKIIEHRKYSEWHNIFKSLKTESYKPSKENKRKSKEIKEGLKGGEQAAKEAGLDI